MSAPEPPKRVPGSAMRFAGIGTELAATLVGACLLGYWIDRRFETSPWGLLTCATVGIVGGMYNMLRRVLGGSLTAGRTRGAAGHSDPHSEQRR